MAKKVNQDVDVIIANNTYGGFIHVRRNGDLVLELAEHGDDNVVTFGELKKEASKLKRAFNDLSIVITGVDSDEFTIEDVVKELRLNDVYNELLSLGEDKLADVSDIDIDIVRDFIEDSDFEDIEKLLKSKKSKLKRTIVETVVEMYKSGEVSDYNKMRLISEYLGYENEAHLWGDMKQE